MDTPTSFGQWLRQRRKALGLTHTTLADRVHCSASSLRKIEHDERRPSYHLAQRLAECLRIPAAEHGCFLAIARAELRVERLAKLAPPPLPPLPELTATTATPRLPLPPTPLIGRARELAAITARLADPACRLLTLLGPGGIGKTRLALAAAWAAHEQARFTDGVHWVALAAVSSSEFVMPSIANAIGLVSPGSIDLRTHLLNFLRDKQLLLVLDNLEQLLASIDWLTELLRQAPALKILATSRERFNLQPEWVLDVPGLMAPPADQTEAVHTYAAVALFLQSAQRAEARFAAHASDWPAIARICHRLEGMPLALELAASWVRLLSCQEIAQQIERGADFLVTSTRDMPERHRSLRAAFDHSWRLLSADEQCGLRGLSVFRGGFRREAAEQVAGAGLPLLAALADKSLLRRTTNGRYEVHELIRQYAASHLQLYADERLGVGKRHSAYFLTWIEELEPALYTSRHPEAMAAVTLDFDNLRLAWEWAVEHRHWEPLGRTARAFWYYFQVRSLFTEGEAFFRQAAEPMRRPAQSAAIRAEAPDRTLGRLQVYQAALGHRMGRVAEAKALARSSIELLRRCDDRVALVDALWFYSMACRLSGESEDASRYAREGYALASSLPYSPWLVEGLLHLGMIVHDRGDASAAYQWLNQALGLSRAAGHPRNIALATSFLCRTARRLGNFREMEQILRDVLHAANASGDRFGMAMALEQLARIARDRGDFPETRRLCHESIELYQVISDSWGLARVFTLLGKALLAPGESAEARRSFTAGFRFAVSAQVYPTALDALAGLAAVWPQPEQALAMAVAVLHHPSVTNGAHDRAERLRAELEAKLTAAQIEAARARALATDLGALAGELRIEAASV